MKGIEKFLFYYSLLAITILFFTSVFFAPKPQNFISLALLIPLIIYFWVKATSPQSTTQNLWSMRVLGVLLVFAVLGIFSYSLGASKEPPQKTAQVETANNSDEEAIKELVSKISALNQDGSNEEIRQELAEIKRQLAKISRGTSSGQTANNTGGAGSTLASTTDVDNISEILKDIPYGFVKISDSNIQEIDVLDDSSFTSQRIGVMKNGVNYEFFDKKDGWYLVKLPDGNQGWVNQRDVEEVY